jgi:CBS domain containing-hemolysin-like protein
MMWKNLKRSNCQKRVHFIRPTELDYLNEKYNLEFPNKESETLSGYIINEYEKFVSKNISLSATMNLRLNVSDTRIEMVRLRILK